MNKKKRDTFKVEYVVFVKADGIIDAQNQAIDTITENGLISECRVERL